ncbi:MAG: ABC transporter ATP-binding protein [Leptolyngbyaceae cyanobacterium bins.59]|nr:ABC transporter ATP-binding protein [Leptolyngbyaceae cyanobacterium bins.59]
MQLLRTKLREIPTRSRSLRQALELVWQAARPWPIVWLGLLILQGLLPVAIAYLSRELTNHLVARITQPTVWETARPVLLFAALLAGFTLLTEGLRNLSNWVRVAQGEWVRDFISDLIHEQAANVDFAFYESSEYYDRLHRAQSEAQSRPIALLENGGGLLQNGLTLIGFVGILIPFGLWLPAILLVSALPAFYAALRYSLQYHQWWLRVTEEERRAWYYSWLLTARDNAAELRVFHLHPHFQKRYRQVRDRLRKERLTLARNQGIAEFMAGGLTFLIVGLVLIGMVWQTLLGFITLGDLVLFYQVFSQGQKAMQTLLLNLNQIYTNSLFLNSMFEFLALKPQIQPPTSPKPMPLKLRQGIEFQNVTFHYPGNDRAALQNFNLTLLAGQVTAIVGNNGAGKSTLIKLLCRFYDPQAGRVLLDGVDLREFSPLELRKQITVLFQQPVYHNDTVAANIAIGDLKASPDRAMIQAAAEAAGADQPIRRLPQGYDTLLGRWFAGGTDLSTGEWQRLALARSFLRPASILILDEPTSAMDSWAEADWLDRFRALVHHQTAIIITHRFTTAMRADQIHVMVDGQVLESGNHQQLLAQKGYYAESWHMQVRDLGG